MVPFLDSPWPFAEPWSREASKTAALQLVSCVWGSKVTWPTSLRISQSDSLGTSVRVKEPAMQVHAPLHPLPDSVSSAAFQSILATGT